MKKITLSTVKSFIRKNSGNLYIDIRSEFNGAIDGLSFYNQGFVKAEKDKQDRSYTLGINGAYFVGSSRDYFSAFENEQFQGITVLNSCGKFILATKK
jgi:hypothetical protein